MGSSLLEDIKELHSAWLCEMKSAHASPSHTFKVEKMPKSRCRETGLSPNTTRSLGEMLAMALNSSTLLELQLEKYHPRKRSTATKF